MFVPANNEKFIKSAKELKKKYRDTLKLVYDLEDSVPENDQKKIAFENVKKHAGSTDWVRVCTRHFQAYEFYDVNVQAVLLPKVERFKDTSLEYWLPDDRYYNSASRKVIALIETAAGVENVAKIAKKVNGVMFGKVDLAASMNSDMYEDFARKRVVLACKAVGVPVYDTPCCSVDDTTIYNHAVRSYDYGFDGVGILHPKEILIVKKAFAPSEDQKKWAKDVLAAYKDRHVAILNGDVIGAPSVKRARQILGIEV